MNTTMITIENRVRHLEIVQAARANGSIENLADILAGFTTHNGPVVLRPHGGCLEYAIMWYADVTDRPYMVGGLIYHASTNDWSVHT